MESCLWRADTLADQIEEKIFRIGLRLAAAVLGLFTVKRQEQTLEEARAERILTEHGDSILRTAYAYLKNRADAEDILQDTLLALMRTNPTFESADYERAWLLRVAANLSKNKIRYNQVRQTDELDENLVAEGREDLSFVWEAVRALPVAYREAIHLFYEEGYSTKEIANILQKNESSVRSDLRRARIRLKEILKEEYDFGEVSGSNAAGESHA